ncbi:MAG: tryptophan-rich sensory protein [Candidatus Peregrinibacteria bacterium]|nr:tryptophan-rich sensory protein [Candidatus Peregrinibacteria bacterium]
MNKKIIQSIVSILGCLSVGIVGALFTTPAIPTWYNTLSKPLFSPPAWVFGPAWTILYIMMGVSLFLVWTKKDGSDTKRMALYIFFAQLLLNAIWSPIFFGLQSPFLGLMIIALLWATIIININIFYKVSKAAALLLVPYFLWVSFATVLNFALWQLNM